MALSNGTHSTVRSRLIDPASPNLDEFKQICSQTTDKATYPLAQSVESNIPIYDVTQFGPDVSAELAARLQDEWYHILSAGPGIYVLKGMYHGSQDERTLTAASAAFQRIITQERAGAAPKGDHFAASGKNDRIWNSFSKHALADPASFVDYYSNRWLRLVSEAWLGPAYRVTAQVNVVKPGGAAQDPHRDYHLGFQELARCAAFPRSIHLASAGLTLQGAVAHTDMPAASGPTRFLPFSQTYEPGYLAWRRDDFRAYFRERYVALPLARGDGVFFNPAVFHAAGANEMQPPADGDPDGGFHRKANLLQISSALGKAMETVDVVPVVERVWDVLKARHDAAGGRVDEALENAVLAIADGYPFPTNLDKRPPAPSGMAPESEQEIILRGLKEGWTTERAVAELRQMKLDSNA
ncbi:phytanoyl-CoA dioxygenase family protein [Aspergillus ambiguus]|uniref:phytanoyl-CoA dioxygenase family protein n=1 Tax=Aspergillus ambiguus TaxID=176160 RepID=UPI003CCD1CC8